MVLDDRSMFPLNSMIFRKDNPAQNPRAAPGSTHQSVLLPAAASTEFSYAERKTMMIEGNSGIYRGVSEPFWVQSLLGHLLSHNFSAHKQ